jgi:hypothetical protein
MHRLLEKTISKFWCPEYQPGEAATEIAQLQWKRKSGRFVEQKRDGVIHGQHFGNGLTEVIRNERSAMVAFATASHIAKGIFGLLTS